MDETVADYVARAKEGDKEAFGRLYSLFLEKIYRFVYYLASDEELAYDITQDAFVRAWRALPRFDRERGSFSTFLYAIARNLVIDNQRKRITFSLEFVGDVGKEENFEEDIDRKERAGKVREILSSLDGHDRELVVLRYFEEMSFKKISKIVGKEEGAVRVKVFRILKSLKEKLEGTI
jgi:RNA polymerase sigma-70 factor (ECF subfamily)